MAIHDSDEEFRLGKVESVLSFLTAHEIRGHLLRPRALGFVKNYNPINWSPTIPQMFITEMVDILNE